MAGVPGFRAGNPAILTQSKPLKSNQSLIRSFRFAHIDAHSQAHSLSALFSRLIGGRTNIVCKAFTVADVPDLYLRLLGERAGYLIGHSASNKQFKRC